MRVQRPMRHQPIQPGLQLARIRKREWFRDFDNQDAPHQLKPARVRLCVLKPIESPAFTAEDLNAGAGGVVDDAEDGEADAAGDADGEGVEDCCGEDEEDEEELGVAADVVEEVEVVRGFFDEGVGYDGDHGGEDAFLGGC